MDAFDSDVLIYAAAPGNLLGERVRSLFPHVEEGGEEVGVVGIGSVLLVPEVLTRPVRDGDDDAVDALGPLLSRLALFPVDLAVAQTSVVLGAKYGLRAADAVHLATAVNAGADRFITNNSKDFPSDIDEVRIVYPADLPAADEDADVSAEE
jgi:predicted nucleic acid-binding protein